MACEECGDKGHLTKHCYVRNDKTLPASMNAEKKQQILAKRLAYKATKQTAMTTAAGDYTAAVAAQIREDEDFLSAMQRLGY